MHHGNVFYGHAAVLARYCGMPAEPPPTIWGYLQHGWNTHDGFAVGHEFVPGIPKLVWSDVVARRGWALGHRDYVVIGSPWAYLMLLRAEEIAATGPGEGSIVFPFHGWEGQQIVGDHAAYADEVRSVEGDVPLTMCLYWNDFERDDVRKTYENKGFRVISLGRRGSMYRDGSQDFLDRQLEELLRHRRVVSNRLGSALFYAATVNREIGVYGDPMVLQNDHGVLGGMQRQTRMFPHLHQERVPSPIAGAAARSELGLDKVMSPTALRHRLGWDDVPDLVPTADELQTTGKG
ncbi:hypothetical protein GCM10027599_10070 [Yimella radicis]